MVDDRDCDILAARSRRGDPRALAVLYRHLAPSLLAYLERMLRERADAEDVLHDAFLRLFEGRGWYTGRGRFRAWLFTVATRLAFDRIKRRRRLSELEPYVRETALPRAAPSAGEGASYRELLERIESALRDVPSAYAVAFHLRVREAFSYREMADICGEPEGTLRSRVHHTLRHLRGTLERDGYTGFGISLEKKEEEPR